MAAALGLYDFFMGEEGASVVVVAHSEAQAGIIWNVARRMTELDGRLLSRIQTFQGKLHIPHRDATFTVMPASAKALEGQDFTLALLDEAGVVNRESYEALTLAQGKRETSTLIGIGTPGSDPYDSVLFDLRTAALANPDDHSLVWREFSAAGFEDHAPDCEHCWQISNPALGDFLHRDAMIALLPPKTRESTFRRARLCQHVRDQAGAFLPPGVWDSLSTGQPVPDGAEVVISLDGSFSADTTALLAATVSPTPHFDVVKVWQPPRGDSDYRIPIGEVEQAIRDSCKRWQVAEIVADPFRWQRSLQILEGERLPVTEFPHSPSRLTAATSDVYNAAVNKRLTHSGNAVLAAHVAAAVVSEDARGMRLTKASRQAKAAKIDLASCLIMAHSRAVWRATKKKKKTRSFAA